MVFFDNALDYDEAFVRDVYSQGVQGIQGTHVDAVMDGDPHNVWGPAGYSTPGARWIWFDLGSEQTVKAGGVVNHNFYVAGLQTLEFGGNNTGATPLTTVGSLMYLNNYDHDPCALTVFAAPGSYRYWRVLMGSSLYSNLMGGIYLAQEVEEFPETPDAPFLESQFHQMVTAETEGGSERRQARGEPFYTRTLRWSGTTQEMADLLRQMWIRQNGRERYFLYVPHTETDNQPTTPMGYYIPEVVRFERLTIRELAPGGRYSIVMTLVGLLRIGY